MESKETLAQRLRDWAGWLADPVYAALLREAADALERTEKWLDEFTNAAANEAINAHRAEQRIKELEAERDADAVNLASVLRRAEQNDARLAAAEQTLAAAAAEIERDERIDARTEARLAAAERVVEAARKLLMDTPLGVPSAGGLSQALAAYDAADAEAHKDALLDPLDEP